ncbi:hypothetical protein NMG60_11022856 [Bertholletia excelsa]
MKLKINKACDLSSISVLPPHARRSSTVPNGLDSSVFAKIQASQIRSHSQPSQQSFSQGVSSQHGTFSQLSLNSLEEIVTNDQIGSQERENSVKKTHCLPPVSNTREESQMQISRSSTNLMRKWNSTTVTGQIHEELERRVGVMGTSLNRFGMILDSIQSDIMQVNKGTKEVLMEMEAIRQKMIANDGSLRLMSKEQDEVKRDVVTILKSISDQGSQELWKEKLKEFSLLISALPEQIDARFKNLKSELCKSVIQEVQAVHCSLPISSQKHLLPNVLSAKVLSSSQINMLIIFREHSTSRNVSTETNLVPKAEVGSWTSVRKEHSAFTYKGSSKEHKQRRLSSSERELRIVIETDEDSDEGFPCLLQERDRGIENYSMAEAREETLRILRKARRRKRKHCNPIILD